MYSPLHSSRSLWRSLGSLLSLTLGARTPLTAQGPVSSDGQHSGTRWHALATLRAGLAADNNVYRLGDSTKSRLDAFTPPGAPGTRFADMAAAADYVTVVRGRLGIAGPGLSRRTLFVRLQARYDLYARNARRNNAVLGLTMSQGLPIHGSFRLHGSLVPSSFSGNYLADAVDLNGDGVIAAGERRYATGRRRDTRVLAGYRQPLIRPRDSGSLAVTLALDAGRITRTYQAPFGYRSYRGPIGRLALAFDLGRSLGLEVGYTRAILRSAPDSAVLLLSETTFNRDFNGNGTLDARAVRTVQSVDFSRMEQSFDMGIRARTTHQIGARIWYRQRWREFSSREPFDVLNGARRDRRATLGADLYFPLTPRVRLSMTADFEIQKRHSTSAAGATGVVGDYSRTHVFLGLDYRL